MKKVGLIGFGRFGEVLYNLLKKNTVFLLDPLTIFIVFVNFCFDFPGGN